MSIRDKISDVLRGYDRDRDASGPVADEIIKLYENELIAAYNAGWERAARLNVFRHLPHERLAQEWVKSRKV